MSRESRHLCLVTANDYFDDIATDRKSGKEAKKWILPVVKDSSHNDIEYPVLAIPCKISNVVGRLEPLDANQAEQDIQAFLQREGDLNPEEIFKEQKEKIRFGGL